MPEEIKAALVDAWTLGVTFLGLIMSFADHHSKGILALVAVCSMFISWYYHHKKSKGGK